MRGLWEPGIKAAKRHIKKTVRNNVLNYEELAATLCDIEAFLNSRPLSQFLMIQLAKMYPVQQSSSIEKKVDI